MLDQYMILLLESFQLSSLFEGVATVIDEGVATVIEIFIGGSKEVIASQENSINAAKKLNNSFSLTSLILISLLVEDHHIHHHFQLLNLLHQRIFLSLYLS